MFKVGGVWLQGTAVQVTAVRHDFQRPPSIQFTEWVGDISRHLCPGQIHDLQSTQESEFRRNRSADIEIARKIVTLQMEQRPQLARNTAIIEIVG